MTTSNNDEVLILSERIGQYQQENDELKRQIHNLKLDVETEQWKRRVVNSIVALAILIPVLLLSFFAGVFVWNVATTPDVATHCVIDENHLGNRDGKLRLYGVVPWGVDYNYGEVASIEDGVRKAKLMNCPLQPISEK